MDTICAIATATGGAITMIRVSGDEAISITGKIFNKDISQAPGRSLHYGSITAYGTKDIIDDVMVSVYRAPHSYTGEDSTEISCHGSAYIASRIIEALIAAGCRQALPGEYTQRAFLNGKMDLSQAEAVADLIASTNAATHRMAMSQLRGNFSGELKTLREKLLKMTSLLELELDFSDQDVEFADRMQLLSLANEIEMKIHSLAASFKTGNAIKKGVPVAIVGKTNTGKSTLLNRIVGEERAIVSDIHGTTRDVIEDLIDLRGVTFRFIDTAGIRATGDTVEQMGIERTWRKIEEAAVVIWLLDAVPSQEEIKDMTERTYGKSLIVAENKIDKDGFGGLMPQLKKIMGSAQRISFVSISAKRGDGIDNLLDSIFAAADIPEIRENDVIITSARHYEALERAGESIRRVINGLDVNLPGDLLAEDLRLCISQLGDITGGAISTEETLQNIFNSFCIGK